MKKVLTLALLMVSLALFMNVSDLNAQNGKGKGKQNKQGKQNSCKFVDANNDGICDNFVDANNDGKCDNCTGTGVCDGTGKGKGMGQGKCGAGCGKFVDANNDGKCDNFVDANNDGKCDNCTGAGKCDGTGKGKGMGQGKCGAGCGKFVDANNDGKCDNFVDANSDGKCDNCTGTGTCDGTRKGKGMGLKKGHGCKGSCGSQTNNNFKIDQNTPNPVTGMTKINVVLQQEEYVKVTLFDYSGSKIKDVFDGKLKAGDNTVEFSVNGLNPGNYLYVVEVAGKLQSKNMMIVK